MLETTMETPRGYWRLCLQAARNSHNKRAFSVSVNSVPESAKLRSVVGRDLGEVATRHGRVQDDVPHDCLSGAELRPSTLTFAWRLTSAHVGVSTSRHVGPKPTHCPRKSPLLFVEVSPVTSVAKKFRRVARLATFQMWAVRGGEPPDSAAAAGLHEVRLPKDKRHLILVSCSQVRKVIIRNCCACSVARVPVVKTISESFAWVLLVEQRSTLSSPAMSLVRLHVAQLVDIHLMIRLIHWVQP
mmetsp:Transcript_118415/g.209298  ORF Transcript_118415/g.209298 Transcript_118415/m.209298 type:complete len:243 (-) Transcript_118415:1187-1915(-)